MTLSDKRVEEFKAIYKKEYGKDLSDSEARDSAQRLNDFCDLLVKMYFKDMEKKEMLEKEPEGFYLSRIGDGTYTCIICHQHISGESGWYDQFGPKCLLCQDALKKGIIPEMACEDHDSFYCMWELKDKFGWHHATVKKMIRNKEIVARIIPDKAGAPHEYLFMINENIELLPPKGIEDMALLLCSDGKAFTDLADKMLRKPLSKLKVAHITTAAKEFKDKSFIKKSQEEMKKLGLDFEELDIEGKDEDELFKILDKKNIIFVDGGNTFYLLKAVRSSGFDKVIKRLMRRGVLYVGASAGSYIMCPTIEMATWKHQDRDKHGLTDLTALGLVPFLITAHYSLKYKKVIKEASEKSKYKVKALADGQAIFVEGGNFQLVGEGEEIII